MKFGYHHKVVTSLISTTKTKLNVTIIIIYNINYKYLKHHRKLGFTFNLNHIIIHVEVVIKY